MTNVEALKNLYAALGGNAADVADAVTNVDVLNAIAEFLGGEADATTISEAIENISAVAPTGSGDINALIDRTIEEIKSDVHFIGQGAFLECGSLISADFLSRVTGIEADAFKYCAALGTLILRGNTVARLSGTAFDNSAIASGTGYIYVPDDLVDSYKAATNWSTYAGQIKGLSELPTE